MLGRMMTGRIHQFTIGDRLRKAREAAGYDQRGFEAASGISRATISAYELGKSKPRQAYLSIWAHVTGTDMDWLLVGEVSHSVSNQETDDPELVTDGGTVNTVSTDDEQSSSSPAAARGNDGDEPKKNGPKIIRGRGPRA